MAFISSQDHMYKFPQHKLAIFHDVLVDTTDSCVEYLYIWIGLENISLDFSALYLTYLHQPLKTQIF